MVLWLSLGYGNLSTENQDLNVFCIISGLCSDTLMSISSAIALRWMVGEPTHDKPTWLWQWLGAVRQQAIAWTNVD